MDYLTEQNKLNGGEPTDKPDTITAKDKIVVVVGGGDTGSDCVGTALRQGAKKVYQLEILPEPPDNRPSDTPWPMWPRIMRTSSSQEEGCDRQWSVCTKMFSGGAGIYVEELHGCEVEWSKKTNGWKMKEIPNTDFTIKTDLVLLALGFVHVEHDGLIKDMGLRLDDYGNITVDNYQTSQPSVFAAGDAVSGASLVVRAINSGRGAAAVIDQWLKKE